MTEKFVYIHTFETEKDQTWRVLPGLLLSSEEKSSAGKNRLTGRILTLTGVDKFQIITTEHFDSRVSASYWVFSAEFEKLRDDIEKDWNRRHCWREAYEDVQLIREDLCRK